MNEKTLELKKLAAGYVDKLAAMTDEAQRAENFQAFITTLAKFHKYSFFNLWLIALQRPDASQVAGYNAWLKLHRYVKKG